MVTEELRPGHDRIVPLSLLVLGDEEARASCARAPRRSRSTAASWPAPRKMVRQSGGTVAQEFAVLDVYRRTRHLKPQGIAELNDGGRALARALAEEVAQSRPMT